MTIVEPLVKAAPKLCLGFGFGLMMGLGGGRASSSDTEEVEMTILVCAVVSPSRNLNLPAFRCRSGGLRSASDKITATPRIQNRFAATAETFLDAADSRELA